MSKDIEAPAQQHIGWLKQFIAGMDESNWKDMRLRAERQLEELSEDLAAASAQHPSGWKLVPIKPTQDMIDIGCDNNPTQWTEGTERGFAADVANDVYVSMVHAAPSAPHTPAAKGSLIASDLDEQRDAVRDHVRKLEQENARLRAQVEEACICDEVADEGIEILVGIIENIRRKGHYSIDATATFLDQGASCFREIKRRLSPSSTGREAGNA